MHSLRQVHHHVTVLGTWPSCLPVHPVSLSVLSLCPSTVLLCVPGSLASGITSSRLMQMTKTPLFIFLNRELNSGPCPCQAGAVPAEPAPSPQLLLGGLQPSLASFISRSSHLQSFLRCADLGPRVLFFAGSLGCTAGGRPAPSEPGFAAGALPALLCCALSTLRFHSLSLWISSGPHWLVVYFLHTCEFFPSVPFSFLPSGSEDTLQVILIVSNILTLVTGCGQGSVTRVPGKNVFSAPGVPWAGSVWVPAWHRFCGVRGRTLGLLKPRAAGRSRVG